MFLFTRKKLVLDVFTTRSEVAEQYPVDYARKFLPEWWKKLPSQIEDETTIYPRPTAKRCVGITEYYKNGIIIPLWSDLMVSSNEGDWQWQFSDEASEAHTHAYEQMTDIHPENARFHMKLISPWLFKCKEDIKWVWTHPSWNFPNNNVVVPSAVVDYKYNPGTNINIFVDNTRNHKTLIPAGLPMVSVFPMSERRVELRRHVVDHTEMSKIVNRSYSATFINKYRNSKRQIDANSGKCPFGFS